MSHLQAFIECARQQQLAHRLAERAVAADVELHGHIDRDAAGVKWYDTAPMLSPHEHCAESIDMAREALEYGVKAGVLVPHPTRAGLVRVDLARPALNGAPA